MRAKVRKTAIAKVEDPVVLGRVTTSDTDPGVQEAAADRLLGLALDGSNSEAAKAAGLLSDVRRVYKEGGPDAVRSYFLDLIIREDLKHGPLEIPSADEPVVEKVASE